MADYGKLILSLSVVLLGSALTFSGFAFAEDQDSSYTHQHITSTWKNDLVCGDHKCASGESSENPTPVEPVRAH